MPVMCVICDKVFSTQSTLNRHVLTVHKESPEPVSYSSRDGRGSNFSSRCLEPGCDRVFKTNKVLMEHLKKNHHMNFEAEFLVMETMNDFENWKSNIEATNNCAYVLKGRKSCTIGETIYYKCNRSKTSYQHKSDHLRTRLPKRQGSCKMASSCTSEIKLAIQNGKLFVEWEKNHYGHKVELQHLRLPKREKQTIATKIINGVPPQRILESSRDNTGEHLKRVDLLTRKDLANIKRSYGLELKDGQRDSNNASSAALWVQECQMLNENPIILNKEQEREHSVSEEEDLCLVINSTIDRDSLISESSAHEKQQTSNTETKIDKIKAMILHLENLDFQHLDDATVSKIHNHLIIINNLAKCSNISEMQCSFVEQ